MEVKFNMSTSTKIKTEMICLEGLHFLHKAEQKHKLLLFKNIEDAQLANKKNQTKRDCSIVCMDETVKEKSLIESTKILLNEFTRLIFISSKGNFLRQEISNIGLNVGEIIYQTEDHDGYSANENVMSQVSEYINKHKLPSFGAKIYVGELTYFCPIDERNALRIFCNNRLVKIWEERSGKYHKTCFKVVTNYSFRITKIYKHFDERNCTEMELELEVIDINGNVFNIRMSARDKHNLGRFRAKLSSVGNLYDCMTDIEFKQILSQLDTDDKPKIIKLQNRPGLSPDQSAWLWADDVEKLED